MVGGKSLCPERTLFLVENMEGALLKGVPNWMTMAGLVTEKHRMIGWFVTGQTFKDHLVQHPCHGLGHLSLDHIAQSPVQLDPLPHWPLSMSLPTRVL